MNDIFLRKLATNGPLSVMAWQMQTAIEGLPAGDKLELAKAKLIAVTNSIALLDEVFYAYESECRRATACSAENARLSLKVQELTDQVNDLKATIKNLEA